MCQGNRYRDQGIFQLFSNTSFSRKLAKLVVLIKAVGETSAKCLVTLSSEHHCLVLTYIKSQHKDDDHMEGKERK